MTNVIRALNSIGKKCFVDYYYQFKECVNKHDLAQKLLKDNSSASSFSAQLTRINYAQWIFDNSQENEALKIIIESKRLGHETILQAQRIYNATR